MKKILLLALVLAGYVGTVSAADDVYLRCNLNATEENNWYSWDNDVTDYKFTFKENNGTEDVYIYSINATSWTGDINFRLHKSTWGNTQQIPYQGQSTVWTFSSSLQATYEILGNSSDYKSDNYANKYFTIDHASVGASEYKITLYWRTDNNRIWMTVDLVSMPATVSGLGYSTFSCNRALDLDNASEGLTAYKASVDNTTKKVVLTKVTGKVAAATGLLLAGTSGTIPVVANSEGTDISSTNALKASVNDTELTFDSTDDTYHYFLAGNTSEDIGFYYLANTYTSLAGKAYLETTTELTADPAPGGGETRVAWVFEDETQGISDATLKTVATDVVYDLQGRVVKNVGTGLYIMNGKKVIVK